MKVIRISECSYTSVTTDEGYWQYYRRHGPENWEQLMGESWEAAYSSEDKLEAAYQKFLLDSEA